MVWASEEAMVDAFVDTLRRTDEPESRGLAVWREVRTQYGRPDVVAVEYSRDLVASRRLKGTADPDRLSTKAAYVMASLIGKRWVRGDNLRCHLSYPSSAFTRAITELRDRGLVATDGERIKAVPKTESLAVRRLWVFEAKLQNWSMAINQAERHLWFTYDTYVLLPTLRKTAIITGECERRGIGLSTYSPERKVTVKVRPAKRGVPNSPLLWIINEAIVGGTYIASPT